MMEMMRDYKYYSTFADMIGIKHCNWARRKAYRLVEDKRTDAFSA